MERKQLYRVLNKDLTSPFQEFQYEFGKEYHCDNFNDDKNVACGSGFYAVDLDGLPYAFNIKKRIYRCEVWGKSVEIDQYKRRYENIVIIDEVKKKELETLINSSSKEYGYDLFHVLFPIDPSKVKRRDFIDSDIDLLRKWASVWDAIRDTVRASVGDSVMDTIAGIVRASAWASAGDTVMDTVTDTARASVCASVGDTVRASVCASVCASVGDLVWGSVWASVCASVWAYISSLFPNIKNWKYIDREKGANPFHPCVELWKRGFVSSFDGQVWHIHQGRDAKIIYEIEKNKL